MAKERGGYKEINESSPRAKQILISLIEKVCRIWKL